MPEWWPMLEKLGTVGVLAAGIIVVWRAYQTKDEQCRALMRELFEHLAVLKDVTGALDRLREK